MKKGILCVLLSLLLLAPLFASCQQTAEIVDTKASVYTLYTITEKSTTPEAVRQVELALNRIVFYRLGIIVKLVMVTEDEYEDLIDAKYAEVTAYQEEKKNNKKNNSSSSSSGASASESDSEVMTGDKILSLLDQGEDIPLEEPRLDIFLVRGYDKYYDLATSGKLAALDEKLNNEAKALKTSIHSTFFTAAKVNKKTYGVPINTAIGDYIYLAFDDEYLDKYNIDPNTITTMEDLQDYLSVIKANEPDVIPLEKAMPSADIDFLSNEGFPALVNNGGVVTTSYDNSDLLDYFAMIARYNALGYFESTSGSESANTAVRFVTGNIDDVTALEKSTGRSYSTSVYSNPVATNENTIDNVFCVSKFVVSNELTDVMELVTTLNTDEQLMNILTYGVSGVNYILDDNNQVARLNDSYMMNPQYTGNSFITYTVSGENPDKWANAIKQNQDAVVSPSLGFTVDYTSFKYTDENGDEITLFEPNYIEIINGVVDKYYPSLMTGTAVDFDYATIYSTAVSEINAEIASELQTLYETRLKAQYTDSIRESVIAKKGPRLLAEATDTVITQIKERLISPLTALLKTELRDEFPSATDEEIEAMIPDRLTDAYINDHLYYIYPEERVNEMIDGIYQNNITSEINAELAVFVETSTYKSALNKILSSSDYLADLNKMLTYDAPDRVNTRFDELIATSISEYTTAMTAEMNTEIETAVNTFIEENSQKLDLTKDQILIKIGYLKDSSSDETSSDTSSDGTTDTEDSTYENWFDFVFKIKLRKMYYGIFGEPK